MSEATGNTAEPSDGHTTPPNTSNVIQFHQVFSEVDLCIDQFQQDAANHRRYANWLYKLAGQLEMAAIPYTEESAFIRQIGDLLAHSAGSIAQEADGLKEDTIEFREFLDLANMSQYDEFDPVFANPILVTIEKYRSRRRQRILLGYQESLEKHCKNIEWLMVVDSIVRPTNTDD